MPFQIKKTSLAGVLVIEPKVFGDTRGFFMETYHKREFEKLGISVEFVQDNHAKSKKGSLRGLHFQKCFPQAKLVRVIRGRVFDVAVDLRKSSATFGHWFGLVLDECSKKQFFVPAGFAHGYLALEDDTEFVYKCSDFYYPEDEGGLLWNDSAVGIEWPLAGIEGLLISDKDKKLPGLHQLGFAYP